MESRLTVGGRYCIGVLLFILHQQTAASEECDSRTTSYGYTSPKGEILIPAGSDLIINCTLEPGQQVRNSSLLFWKLDTKEVNDRSVIILNDKSAQLRIPKVQKSSFTAYCAWRNATGHTIDIWCNKVLVAEPPTENVPINCTSYDFKKITCWWNLPPPDNLLQTNWEFKQKIHKTLKNCSHPITGHTNGRSLIGDFCATATPCFILTGSNKLGKSISWLTFDHYNNVILSAPTKLHYDHITERTADISWDDNSTYKTCSNAIINTRGSKALLDYSIIVKKKNGDKDDVYELTTTKSLSLFNLTPFTNYEVKIRSRFVYNGYSNSWSESTCVKFKTRPSVPAMSPSNVVAHISTDSIERNVTLYWTRIPREQQLGNDLRYSVTISSKNLESSVETTANTFIRLSKLSTQWAYTFEIQAENEVGVSNEASPFYLPKSDMNEGKDLIVDDVIMQDVKNGFWDYTLSWKTSQMYNLSLYWCRGNKRGDGLIQCEDFGIHFQEMVSGSVSNYSFSLPNPASQEHFFGVAPMKANQSQRILWSSCVIPTSRKPASPQLNPVNIGSTWVYLSWKPLKCEQRAAYTSGYKINVTRYGKESVNYFVKAEITAFNVTELSPHTDYMFGISTMTLYAESDSKTITISTLQLASQRNQNKLSATSIIGFITLTLLLGALLSAAGYFMYKRYRKRINELNNIQLPSGFTEKYNQPLFITQPTNPKEPWHTSQGGFPISHYGYDIVENDEWSSASSPTGSTISSHVSSKDSGFEIETPIYDIAKQLLEFGNAVDSQKPSRTSARGYSKAILLDPNSLVQALQEDSALRETHHNPMDHSPPANSSPPCSAAESCGFPIKISNYVQVDGFSFLELSKDNKENDYYKQNIAALSTSLETQLGNATKDESNLTIRDFVVPELIKDGRIPITTPNLMLNSVGSSGYAQLSIAVDQMPSSQHLSAEPQRCDSAVVAYTKVALATEELQTLQNSLK